MICFIPLRASNPVVDADQFSGASDVESLVQLLAKMVGTAKGSITSVSPQNPAAHLCH